MFIIFDWENIDYALPVIVSSMSITFINNKRNIDPTKHIIDDCTYNK